MLFEWFNRRTVTRQVLDDTHLPEFLENYLGVIADKHNKLATYTVKLGKRIAALELEVHRLNAEILGETFARHTKTVLEEKNEGDTP